MSEIVIVGAGIGGLTAALELHRAGLECRVLESAEQIRPVGVGINVLPHASRQLAELGLDDALRAVAVLTRESVFFNRFGQLIYREPAGQFAGYDHPQFSIHRAALHTVLLDAVRDRLGADAVATGQRVTGFAQESGRIRVAIDQLPDLVCDVLIGCDGIHSAVRRQLFPDEGAPRYSGVNMWRGVAAWPRFLSGASMTRVGWLTTGKLVAYPIADVDDGTDRQLVNWVAEVEVAQHTDRDWTRRGRLEDFAHHFADWQFDWLDVPALLEATEEVLEYPMVDQDPLPRWSFGRVSLLGDAAHPMVPRGSNGAGQAILDARALAQCLSADRGDAVSALRAYEAARRPPTTNVVHTNRTNPPDAILREVYERTGDRPFGDISDVITPAELSAMSEGYKQVAGFSRTALQSPA